MKNLIVYIMIIFLLFEMVLAIDQEMFTAPVIDQEMYSYSTLDTEYNTFFGYVPSGNVTVIVVPYGGGSSASSSTKCELIYPSKLTFNKNMNSLSFNITNFYYYPLNVKLQVNDISTLFGKEDYLTIANSQLSFYQGQTQQVEILLNKLNQYPINLTSQISIVAPNMNCPNISITIKPSNIFYDVFVKSKQLIYFKNEPVLFNVMLNNKGDMPDSDTILKIYVITPSGKTSLFSEEVIYEPQPGITTIEKQLILDTKEQGIYKIEVEYFTESQGLLKANTSFLVASFDRIIILVLAFTVIGGILLIFATLLVLKKSSTKDVHIDGLKL